MSWDAPLRLWEGPVEPDWIDEFGHVNIAHYLTIADKANWAFWNAVNAPDDMDARGGHEYVIVENHVRYGAELTAEDTVRIETQVLAHDAKRFILFHRLIRVADGALSATNEAKFLGFSLVDRRPEAWSERVAARLAEIADAHGALSRPPEAGLGIDLARR